MDLTIEDKKKLLILARESIQSSFENTNVDLSKYSEYSEDLGVFVTLTIDGNLRGCVGYPGPYYPLNQAIFNAARAAAFEDKRFELLTEKEFKKIKLEISVLTKPEIISVKNYHDYLKKIEVGRDGLIIESGPNSGLLLPQVPVEWKWDVNEYLENLCHKASLAKDEWKEPGVKIYSFQAIIFSE